MRVGIGFQIRDRVIPSCSASTGRFSIQWAPTPRLVANVSSYFCGEQTFEHHSTTTLDTVDIDPKFILDVKVSYRLANGFSVYANLRNVVMTEREFGFSDEIRGTFLLGVRYEH